MNRFIWYLLLRGNYWGNMGTAPGLGTGSYRQRECPPGDPLPPRGSADQSYSSWSWVSSESLQQSQDFKTSRTHSATATASCAHSHTHTNTLRHTHIHTACLAQDLTHPHSQLHWCFKRFGDTDSVPQSLFKELRRSKRSNKYHQRASYHPGPSHPQPGSLLLGEIRNS